MRRIAGVAGLALMFCLAVDNGFAAPPPASKSAQATIVIVFKDGHRQSFNLADIARVEFPAGAAAATAGDTASSNHLSPSRARFRGKWQVGDGSGNDFYIMLKENGDAYRSLRSVHGKWAYVNGEAQVTWDDGAKDAIRKVGSIYEKFAYSASKSFTDEPDNVANARNLAAPSI
jgi:hypothetical protein